MTGFDSFIGNRKVVDRLRGKLRQNRFPHGLLFAGPEGVGKRTLAIMIAKALNCTNLGPVDFCEDCSQCRKIQAGTHPDVQTITVEEDATRIKIAQIRALLSTLEMRPLEGRNKVFIIDPANLMDDPPANALLKGLEEPPDNSYFILLAVNSQELLVTIRSRSQTYHFAPLTLADVRSKGITDEFAIRWSQGSIGRAQTVDVAATKDQRATVIEFIEAAVHARDETLREMLAASAELGRTKQDFSAYLTMLTVVLGDILYLAEGTPDRIVNADIRERLEKIAASAPSERWIRVSEFLRFMETSLKGNANKQLLTDAMALVTAEIGNDIAAKSR